MYFRTRDHILQFLALSLTIIAAVVFLQTLGDAVLSDSGNSEVPIPAASATSSAQIIPVATSMAIATSTGRPLRLIIPALGIDAHVKAVGVTAAGNMATAGNFTDVGWYKYGTVPGMKGSAVMDGHVDNGLALAGVFKHLGDLKPGDDVYVLADSGDKLHFVVSSAVAYDYQAVPTDLIFNDRSGARLRLITCTGSWVKGDKTYDKRLVVTADLQV